MSASAKLITDVTTVITNGPNAATAAKAIAAAGQIQDYIGNSKLSLLKLQEASVLYTAVKGVTDSSTDSTNLALINGILAALNNTGSPGTTLVTDGMTLYNNNLAGIVAATSAKANAVAGPIQDVLGNLQVARRKLQEVKVLMGLLIGVTDSTDSANLALLQSVQLALA